MQHKRVARWPVMRPVLEYLQWMALWLVEAGSRALRVLGLPLLLCTIVGI